ncbi:MAG: hypothetical protein ABH841_01555 [Candidatus Nealsonbacteria bacterium]
MNTTVSPKLIALTFGVLVISFLATFYVVAWTEPSQAPPAGNVAAPLNSGNVGQSKEGGLILNTGGAVNGLIIDKGNLCIGTDCRSAWPIAGGTPIPGGLYGSCYYIRSPGGGYCGQAFAPAFCSGIYCACPGGYTMVQTGRMDNEPSGWPELNWVSCYKN